VYIVQDDVECDRVSQAISGFCIESNAKVNYQKSSFLRIKQYKLGPPLIREDSKLKDGTDLKKTTLGNYERNINTIKFMINQNCRGNLNLIQKVWVSNTFILAKLWYISQIMPPENLHLGKIKKAIGNFLWFGYLYEIDRRQLVMSYLKGGLALTNVELKTKSLFLRANLFKKVGNIFVDREDFLFVERNTLRLSRNVQEAFTTADDDYLTLLEKKGFTKYIEVHANKF
jgi:hypothetical protein